MHLDGEDRPESKSQASLEKERGSAYGKLDHPLLAGCA